MKPKVLAAAAQKLKHLAPEFPSEMEAQPLPRLKPRPTQPRTRLTTARSPPSRNIRQEKLPLCFHFLSSSHTRTRIQTHTHQNMHYMCHHTHTPSYFLHTLFSSISTIHIAHHPLPRSISLSLSLPLSLSQPLSLLFLSAQHL